MLPQNKLISFILPTRERKDLLFSCINNLLNQIPEDKRKLIEIIIRMDTDDKTAKEIITELPHDKIDFQVHLGYHGRGYVDGYIWAEEGARLSRGTYFAFWNDDAKFATDDWLSIFINKIKSEKNIFSYWFSGPTTTVKSADGSIQNQEWPCFIFLHRKLWEIMGFVSGPGGVDSFLAYVLDPLGLLRKIPEIKIDHTPWYEKPKESWDAVTKAISQPGQTVPTDFKLVEYCKQRIVDFVNKSKATSPS